MLEKHAKLFKLKKNSLKCEQNSNLIQLKAHTQKTNDVIVTKLINKIKEKINK